jgi:hypothetical protein
MNTVLQVTLVSVLITFGFLLVGLILWYRTKRLIARAQKASGVVIKIKRITFENRDTFSPVIRFTTSDGRALSFTHPVFSYPPEFKVGDHADVLYDPNDPHKARAVKNVSDLFLTARLFGTAGTALLAAGILIGAVLGTLNYLPLLF